MNIILTVVFGLFGTAIGSFLNVCIDRLPAGKSLVYPPSHCDVCRHRLMPKDLVPLFSYLLLRGRCRYCRVPIPRRVFWIELVSGLLFAFTYWQYGLSVDFAVTVFYCCVFIVIGVIDLEHKLILNRIVYPVTAVALLISIFLLPSGIAGISLPWSEVVNGIMGGTIGFVLFLIPVLIYPVGMGWGDVKAAALIGVVTGFPLVFVAILIGVILGGLVAGLLLLLKVKKRREAIPFGPFLSLATIITLFWGSGILNWYLGFF